MHFVCCHQTKIFFSSSTRLNLPNNKLMLMCVCLCIENEISLYQALNNFNLVIILCVCVHVIHTQFYNCHISYSPDIWRRLPERYIKENFISRGDESFANKYREKRAYVSSYEMQLQKSNVCGKFVECSQHKIFALLPIRPSLSLPVTKFSSIMLIFKNKS